MAKASNIIITEDKLKQMLAWHNKSILNLLKNGGALFTIIDTDFVFYITKKEICFIIFKDLITKKNNYEIWYNQKVKQELFKIIGSGKINPTTLFSKIKQMVFIGKNEKVRKDEKFFTGIFDAINQMNYSYILEHNGWKIFFVSNYFQHYFPKIFLNINAIDDTNKQILLDDEIEKYRTNIRNFFSFYFKTPFFQEDYFYITEYNSIGEKDISNTPELFNDCFQDGSDILSHWSIFNDKQILRIRWNKLYYEKKDAVFTPFYIFKLKPIDF